MRNQVISLALITALLCPFASAQWVRTDFPFTGGVASFTVFDGNLFAGTSGAGVFRSTNNGTSWMQTGMTDGFVFALAVSGTNLFAGTFHNGVYLSPNSGGWWIAANAGMEKSHVYSLAVSGTNLFAADADSGVYRSTNNGTDWTATSLTNAMVRALAVSGTNLFAGTWGSGGGVNLSTDNGTSWTQVNTGLHEFTVVAFAVSGATLFVGAGDGVYLSTNNGTNWIAASAGLTNTNVHALAVSGATLFAGTGGGVFRCSTSGGWWTEVSTGLTNADVSALAVSGTYLFAAITDTGGVWRRPVTEMITAVEISSDLPEYFSLEQNYPNPFNPSTNIKFDLPTSSEVRLSVFDLLGREVSVLVNEKREAGYHEVNFNASGLSSGVYFYRLQARLPQSMPGGGQAGEFVHTRKLLLLR